VKARATAALALAALAACALAVAFSAASFTDSQQNPQTVSAVADWTAPSAEASVIAGESGVAGKIAPSEKHYVYAKVSESGNPASGVASVKANVSAITSGSTAVSLSAGSYSAGGVSYNYRSAELTAGSALKSGTLEYTLALADAAGNSREQGFSVTVESATPFAGADFATENGRKNTEGKPEEGDSIFYTFTNAPKPSSIVPKWDGSGTASVTVSIEDESSNVVLTVSGATIGEVTLEGNYAANKKTAVFTKSELSLSGSVVTIVLGKNSSNAKKDTNENAPAWMPVASILDLAGNACSTAVVTSANERQF
jgi:hypothetical protein